MMKIDCPWCGARPENEFNCGGEADVQRPGPAASVSDAQWGDYLFYRRNTLGVHTERWRHTFGCGQWFTTARDTLSHAFVPAGAPAGELSQQAPAAGASA